MALKYGDAVTLVKKSPDGKTFSRVNATVIRSAIQPAKVKRSQALKDVTGALAEGEYLDLLFPREQPVGLIVKSLAPEEIFQKALVVAPFTEGSTIGWEPINAVEVKTIADMNKGIAILRQQLAEATKGKKEK